MIEISFWTVEIALAIVWLLVRVTLCVRRHYVDWHREILSLAMLVNVAIILRFTMFPFALVDGKVQPLPFDATQAYPPRLNYVPFAELLTYDSMHDTLINLIGNCAMFIPSGILLPILYPRLDSFARVVGAGACMSIAIEIVQLPFHTRVSDVNDLLLNTLGVAIGYGVYALVKQFVRTSRTTGA